jgi:hypothetical protein
MKKEKTLSIRRPYHSCPNLVAEGSSLQSLDWNVPLGQWSIGGTEECPALDHLQLCPNPYPEQKSGHFRLEGSLHQDKPLARVLMETTNRSIVAVLACQCRWSIPKAGRWNLRLKIEDAVAVSHGHQSEPVCVSRGYRLCFDAAGVGRCCHIGH